MGWQSWDAGANEMHSPGESTGLLTESRVLLTPPQFWLHVKPTDCPRCVWGRTFLGSQPPGTRHRNKRGRVPHNTCKKRTLVSDFAELDSILQDLGSPSTSSPSPVGEFSQVFNNIGGHVVWCGGKSGEFAANLAWVWILALVLCDTYESFANYFCVNLISYLWSKGTIPFKVVVRCLVWWKVISWCYYYCYQRHKDPRSGRWGPAEPFPKVLHDQLWEVQDVKDLCVSPVPPHLQPLALSAHLSILLTGLLGRWNSCEAPERFCGVPPYCRA